MDSENESSSEMQTIFKRPRRKNADTVEELLEEFKSWLKSMFKMIENDSFEDALNFIVDNESSGEYIDLFVEFLAAEIKRREKANIQKNIMLLMAGWSLASKKFRATASTILRQRCTIMAFKMRHQ